MIALALAHAARPQEIRRMAASGPITLANRAVFTEAMIAFTPES